jgi:hypothetical protein
MGIVVLKSDMICPLLIIFILKVWDSRNVFNQVGDVILIIFN